jgi:ubiquitin-protein ligase
MSAAAMKRLPKEIRSVCDLSNSGIYYLADEASLYKGHAMIIGPEDTPYAYCPLFFRFEFTNDYPFSPPKVTFLTTDGKTRFHPNLYVCGKVCLSILGTYTGPSWQSTMSLSMILLSLKALLDTNPISHEPGYATRTLSDPLALHYSQYVHYKMTELSLWELRKGQYITLFREDIPHLLPTLEAGLEKIVRANSLFAPTKYDHLPYSMVGTTAWKNLLPYF